MACAKVTENGLWYLIVFQMSLISHLIEIKYFSLVSLAFSPVVNMSSSSG